MASRWSRLHKENFKLQKEVLQNDKGVSSPKTQQYLSFMCLTTLHSSLRSLYKQKDPQRVLDRTLQQGKTLGKN
jgi:hypothetical protein